MVHFLEKNYMVTKINLLKLHDEALGYGHTESVLSHAICFWVFTDLLFIQHIGHGHTGYILDVCGFVSLYHGFQEGTAQIIANGN